MPCEAIRATQCAAFVTPSVFRMCIIGAEHQGRDV